MSSSTALYRRTIRVLVLSQALAGAGLAAGITVGALLAEDMVGSTGSAGVPAALLTLGSALAATGVGRLSQCSGRRPGLAAGYAVGALGGVGVVLAAVIDSVGLLFVSLLLYGSGAATSLQARYAGTDLAPADRRGRAVSTVLVATTLGAVVGPIMAEPAGRLAGAFGVPELAGPFILASAAYALAAVAVLILLRPDPLVVARAAQPRRDVHLDNRGGVAATSAIRLAAAAMILSQLVMVAVMTMTPIHMLAHGHTLSAAGLVISIHIAAMYLPSLVTGVLVDRVGRRPVLAASGITLLAAGVLAAAAPADSVLLLALALGLLGLGWNFGLVGGTALLTDAVPLSRRARTQGTVDVAVGLSGATGGLASGVVAAVTSFAALSLAGGLLSLALLPLLGARRRARRRSPVEHEAVAPSPGHGDRLARGGHG